MKLGIFDSGIGGKIIAKALGETFPNAEIITVNDHKNVPYGDKTKEQVIILTDKAIQPLILANCDIIIIACNTATALAIEYLRAKYKEQKFIGIEPMVKDASRLTKTGTIAVCATKATLKSDRYNNLKNKFKENINILEPDCNGWAYMIETNNINEGKIVKTINELMSNNADIIVLGCTHYHWIKDLINNTCKDKAIVLEPSEAIGRRVKELLKSS
ncbi:MAG: aspartate/glutamate racemase family protein [Candidatus Saccharibacteria bacterium]